MVFIRLLRATNIGGEGLRPEMRRRRPALGDSVREHPRSKCGRARVVVRDVLAEQSPQVVFNEDDHMIEKLTANAAHEAFGRSVLPGTSVGGSPGMDPQPPNRAGDLRRED